MTVPTMAVDVVSSMGMSIATTTDMAQQSAHDNSEDVQQVYRQSSQTSVQQVYDSWRNYFKDDGVKSLTGRIRVRRRGSQEWTIEQVNVRMLLGVSNQQ